MKGLQPSEYEHFLKHLKKKTIKFIVYLCIRYHSFPNSIRMKDFWLPHLAWLNKAINVMFVHATSKYSTSSLTFRNDHELMAKIYGLVSVCLSTFSCSFYQLASDMLVKGPKVLEAALVNTTELLIKLDTVTIKLPNSTFAVTIIF